MAKYCSNCGKMVNEDQDICLNCGKAINNKDNSEQNNKMAMTGFYVSLFSLILNFGGIVGLVAFILSTIGLTQVIKTHEKGKAFAIIGMIVGLISIAYGIYSINNLIEVIKDLY